MAQNVYQMVTDRIVEEMAKGIIPWKKPWSGAKLDAADAAISYTSRRAYSVLNQWLLGKPGEYLTFNQVKENGGSVKHGAKARFVVFYTKVQHVEKNEETGEEKVVSYPLLKYYNVFHIDDCEGIQSKTKPGEKVEIETDKAADAIIAAYVEREAGFKFINNNPSDKAYYSPSGDYVVVPMPSQFKEISEYYSTSFHELVHSTMRECRCNRKAENAGAFFGNHNYSREELVAEIGSAMLCSRVGIEVEKTFRNSVAYIQSWIAALKNDPKMIVWAAGRAETAAKYILNEA